MSPRPKDRILANLETIFREAYEQAKQDEDTQRMLGLDSSYQREQLLLEVLLDIRDVLHEVAESKSKQSAIEKLSALKKLTKLK